MRFVHFPTRLERLLRMFPIHSSIPTGLSSSASLQCLTGSWRCGDVLKLLVMIYSNEYVMICFTISDFGAILIRSYTTEIGGPLLNRLHSTKYSCALITLVSIQSRL